MPESPPPEGGRATSRPVTARPASAACWPCAGDRSSAAHRSPPPPTTAVSQNGCLDGAPCTPFTSHGASIRQPHRTPSCHAVAPHAGRATSRAGHALTSVVVPCGRALLIRPLAQRAKLGRQRPARGGGGGGGGGRQQRRARRAHRCRAGRRPRAINTPAIEATWGPGGAGSAAAPVWGTLTGRQRVALRAPCPEPPCTRCPSAFHPLTSPTHSTHPRHPRHPRETQSRPRAATQGRGRGAHRPPAQTREARPRGRGPEGGGSVAVPGAPGECQLSGASVS
eukprot:SAG25_NODE_2214_length_1831_cov_1.740335_1_plen_281_part_00